MTVMDMIGLRDVSVPAEIQVLSDILEAELPT